MEREFLFVPSLTETCVLQLISTGATIAMAFLYDTHFHTYNMNSPTLCPPHLAYGFDFVIFVSLKCSLLPKDPPAMLLYTGYDMQNGCE